MTFFRKGYPNLAIVAHVQLDQGEPGQKEVVVQREVTNKRTLHKEPDDRICASSFRGGRKVQCIFRGPGYGAQAMQQRPRGGPVSEFRTPGPEQRVHFKGDFDAISRNNSPQDGICHRRSSSSYRWAPRTVDVRFDGGRRGVGVHTVGDGGRKNKTWYKMIIPYGKKYDKNWLLKALQNMCSVPFTPLQYQIQGHEAHFYIDDGSTAYALCSVSHQITDNEGYQVVVLMDPCPPPSNLNTQLKPRDIQHLKQCMAKRFDTSHCALDLNNLHSDPELRSENISAILSRKTFVDAVGKVIKENIPELVRLNLSNNNLYRLDHVADLINNSPHLKTLDLSHNELKTVKELDRLKGLKLVELWLDRNPLCDLLKDKPTYINAVRERFPQLLKLDGHDLPPVIVFDVVTPTTIPPCTGSYFVSEEIKFLILHFLQQYYSVYDSGDRQPLLGAYHDRATFSLSQPSSQPVKRCNLRDYRTDSRNMKQLKDPSTRFCLLKHTRVNVVSLINNLPKTQHDTASFNVDVNAYTSTLLSFTVSGLFKEVAGTFQDSVRAFSRVFIAVPAGNSGLCIVNDELFVRNATKEEICGVFAAPPASGGPVVPLSTPQQEMLSAFSVKSGMNLVWSQKCLQDNDWDFNKAGHIFTQMQAEGKIPGVAFIK
ncbi:hypothetical protein UPYG_G00212460 [Umbra pygmaea]|uniref:Nuclear RNA export factor 1 n=1 Tax=Umbra pygmaea TaxID=75934 RepID=A0ABD0WK34_UMBPY